MSGRVAPGKEIRRRQLSLDDGEAEGGGVVGDEEAERE
jgi:hypothetical protein